MNYNNLDEVKDLFLKGAFTFPETFTVAEKTYTSADVSPYTVMETILTNTKSGIAYVNEDADTGIVFLWARTPKFSIVPYDVQRMSLTGAQPQVQTEGEGRDENFIGSTVEIRITNMPGGVALKGKVDTGADVCSLHAENWKINNGNVSFQCPELSSNIITVPLVDQQAVKTSDGGVEYRPVIELNIRINGKLINGVMFNLNDRGKMNFPVLVGRNALQAGKFKIDPSLDENAEGVNWDYIQKCTKHDVVVDPTQEQLKTIIKQLQDITNT